MAIQPEEKTWLADTLGFDSDRNFVFFKIEDYTDDKIANRFVNQSLSHPENYSFYGGDLYKCVAMWSDSAGEIQLSSDCTEITE